MQATWLALYRLLLRAYPRSFREAFGDEMLAVFAEALDQAARRGAGPAAAFLAREWAQAPAQVLHEHWRARPARLTAGVLQAEAGMSTPRATRGFIFTTGAFAIVLALVLWLLAVTGWGVEAGFLLPGTLLLVFAVWVLAWGFGPAVRRVKAGVWIGAGLVALAGLAWPTSLLVDHALAGRPPWVGLLLFSLPLAALIVAAGLLGAGLTRLQAGPSAFGVGAVCLGLSTLLVAKTLHNVYWLMVWDATYDPLRLLWLIPIGLAGLLGGLLLVTGLAGRAKWAGLYGLVVIASLAGIAARTDHYDFRQLTTQRAARVATALDAYYAREGRYPTELKQLGLWHRLTLAGPVIINGQDWCYRAGDDYYELGYVDRDHWSSPNLVGQVFSTRGTAPAGPPLCAAEIAALNVPPPAAHGAWAWPVAAHSALAGVEAGMRQAEVRERMYEVWHRDSCVPQRQTTTTYAVTDLFWYGAHDVTQATVVAVHYQWNTAARQWLVDRAELADTGQLYALYGHCSTLELEALAP